MPDWWENGDEVHRTARWLVSTGTLDEPARVVDYFEKPWKWDPEHAHMVEHDRLEREIRAHFGVRAHEYQIDQRVEEACKVCRPDEACEDCGSMHRPENLNDMGRCTPCSTRAMLRGD